MNERLCPSRGLKLYDESNVINIKTPGSNVRGHKYGFFAISKLVEVIFSFSLAHVSVQVSCGITTNFHGHVCGICLCFSENDRALLFTRIESFYKTLNATYSVFLLAMDCEVLNCG